MTKLRGKDLSTLYPEPKSYDELKAEKEQRAEKRRPKHADIKLSLWATLCIATIVLGYLTVSSLVSSNLDSSGGVIFGVSASALIVFVVAAVLYYTYSNISNVAQKIFARTSVFYTAVLMIAFVVMAMIEVLTRLKLNGALIITSVLILNFLMCYLVVRFLMRREQRL